MALQMQQKAAQKNHVLSLVEEENLQRKRTAYQTVKSFHLTDFPILSFDDLRELNMGIYQLKKAPQYTRQHYDSDSSNYEIQLFRDKPNLIRCKIQSRHTNSTVHTLWIEYDIDTVTGWYCTCTVGSRNVGGCTYINSCFKDTSGIQK